MLILLDWKVLAKYAVFNVVTDTTNLNYSGTDMK